MNPIQTDVLIVGGGPVGLSLSLALAEFGVRTVIVERRGSRTNHPKAHGCNVRTMEIFRSWGIERQVVAGGLPPDSSPTLIMEGSAVGNIIGSNRQMAPINSPARFCMVAQDVVEEVLEDAVVSTATGELRRSVELTSFEQDGDSVRARLRDLSAATDLGVEARFLIGCDGADSRVRELLGVSMQGPDAMARVANFLYRADVSHLPHTKNLPGFSVYPTPDQPPIPVGWAVFAKNDGKSWQYMQHLWDWKHPGEEVPMMTEDELVSVVRRLWGIPDLEVELVNVLVWTMKAQLATHWRDRRVLLAGDAAHVIPPAGGFGMNSGIQDAHNLAWKLAMVMSSTAEDGLLDTYELERRPVLQSNIAWATGNAERMFGFAEVIQRRHEDPAAFRELVAAHQRQGASEGQSMGYIYERGAVVDDGSPVPEHDPYQYWPCDRPGARFPHMWVNRDWTESTLDWFTTDFVLVCGPNADAWRAVGEQIAGEGHAPLTVRSLPTVAGYFTFDLDGAVLVRPDGHVAWRPGGAADADALRSALNAIVAGGTEAAARLAEASN